MVVKVAAVRIASGGLIVGILLVVAPPACEKTDLVGKWEAIKDRPNCDREKQFLSEEVIFVPDGTYRRSNLLSDS